MDSPGALDGPRLSPPADLASRLRPSHLAAFLHVTLPQIRLAVLGSGLFAFNVSFDEVVVTLYISGVRTKTLPVKVWDAILYEITPILPAVSTVVIVASVLLLTPLLLARRSS